MPFIDQASTLEVSPDFVPIHVHAQGFRAGRSSLLASSS
jgi:hypothetical protein